MAHFWYRANSLIHAIGVSPLRFAVLNSLIRAISGPLTKSAPINSTTWPTFGNAQIRLSAQFAVLNSIIRVIRCTQFAYSRN